MAVSTGVIPSGVRGRTAAEAPSMSRMLAMLEPTTLPSAMAVRPFATETSDEASSGSDVPPATSVMAIVDSATPSARAMAVALPRKSSPPKTSPASPAAIFAAAGQSRLGGVCPAGAGGAVRRSRRMVHIVSRR